MHFPTDQYGNPLCYFWDPATNYLELLITPEQLLDHSLGDAASVGIFSTLYGRPLQNVHEVAHHRSQIYLAEQAKEELDRRKAPEVQQQPEEVKRLGRPKSEAVIERKERIRQASDDWHNAIRMRDEQLPILKRMYAQRMQDLQDSYAREIRELEEYVENKRQYLKTLRGK